jgi:hypothetical protein
VAVFFCYTILFFVQEIVIVERIRVYLLLIFINDIFVLINIALLLDRRNDRRIIRKPEFVIIDRDHRFGNVISISSIDIRQEVKDVWGKCAFHRHKYDSLC